MKQLKTTIAKLKQDPLHAITVKDLETGTKLLMNANGAFLTENYGSPEGFFENLHKKEIYNFEVQDRRKNGTTFKLETTYQVDASPKTESPVMKEPVYKAEVHSVPNFFQTGLNAPGLNMMDVSHKVGDYPRVLQELATLKDKNERLEKENKKLEIENLKHELAGNKSAVNAESLKSFAPIISQILPMLMGGRGGNPQTALMAPAGDLSPLKNQFIEMIKITDDDMIEQFIMIAQGIATNEAFDNELIQLMTKHNLLQE